MCTGIRFTDTEGRLFFGRNLDWSSSYGEKPLIVPRGFRRRWAFEQSDHNTLWPAVIGMGIEGPGGEPLLFDCMNEHGLAVANLNFPGYAAYEDAPLSGKTNVAAYELPFWIASRFKTVDQAQEALEEVAVVGKPVSERYPVAYLHWFIADAKRSLVVEYMADGMHLHCNDVDVLTNQPAFDWHRENLRNYMNVGSDYAAPVTWGELTLSAYGAGGCMRGLPGDYYSPSRFVRAAYLNASYPPKETEAENVSRLFHTLAGSAMCEGGARMQDGNFEKTLYTSGYSAATRTLYYNSYDDPAIRARTLREQDAEGSKLIVG